MINWEEAPEGTTHSFPDKGGNNHWRKVDEHDVFYWNADEWQPIQDEPTNPAEWEEKYVENGTAIARPAPIEAELPEGKVWPEGADFYYTTLGVFFSFEKPGFKYPNDKEWTPLALIHVQQYAKRLEIIHRFPGAQPKAAPKEEPPKKRAVGWWT